MAKHDGPRDPHPPSPPPPPQETGVDPEANDRATVRMRAGVTTGAMRWVLGIGLVLAILAMGLVWGLAPAD